MSFADALASVDKKGITASNDTFVNYPTGIAPLDYANGFWLTVKDTEHGGGLKQVPITGIIGGTFLSIIGTTGSGKSTLADQIGYSIIKPFADGMLFHIDCELTNLKQRMVHVCGTTMDDDRLRLKKDAIYIDEVLNLFNMLCEVKEKSGDLYKYEVYDRTYDGRPFKAYVPTVIIIDSLPSFNTQGFDVETTGTNMDAARGARDITRFFVNCLNRMMKYNITIITINHIKPKVNPDLFSQPVAGISMLKPNESLPRSFAAQYYSQNYFRCNSIKSNMYKKEDVGFEGFKNTIQIAKTKTAFVGATLDVAFNGNIGYDPIYTLFEFASSVGIVEGRNPWLYFKGLEAFKFSRKDFRAKFLGEEMFRVGVMETLQPYLEALLGSKDISEEERVQFGDLSISEEKLQAQDIEAEKELLKELKTTKSKAKASK